MAEIQLSLQEAVDVVLANVELPEQITDLKACDDGVLFKVKTPIPFLPAFPVSVKYIGFADGVLTLQMGLLGLDARISPGMIGELIKERAAGLGEHIQIEYPHIRLDINKLISNRISGLEIKNVACESGQVFVTVKGLPIKSGAPRSCIDDL